MYSTKVTCIICNNEMLERTSKHGVARKHCSSKCVKRSYALRNPESDAASKRKYAEANRDKHAAATEKYRKEHPGYYREYSSLYTRKVQQAKLSWLSEFDDLVITEMYDAAVKRKLHVDHIIPITHKSVCGLHVPWNLQLLTPFENQSKSNKFICEDVIAIVGKGENNV